MRRLQLLRSQIAILTLSQGCGSGGDDQELLALTRGLEQVRFGAEAMDGLGFRVDVVARRDRAAVRLQRMNLL
jgi:hypothetical protein